MDAVDLDSLAWRAVELAVQRRHDPRLIVATRPTIAGPSSTARLVAGLCNAAAGRRALALFGLDGTDIVGVDEVPDATWLDTIAARFPGVVPTLATATIDADGARIVALTADDPATLVVATRAGRAVVPWFDGTLADRPPPTGVDRDVAPPPGRLEVRTGWLERTGTCAPGPLELPSGADCSGVAAGGADTGIGVWRGFLDVALGRDPLIHPPEDARVTDAAAAGDRLDLAANAALAELVTGRTDLGAPGPELRRGGIAIADRDLTVTLLADGSAAALSLDVQVHPKPGAASAVRSDGGVVLDPLVPCRLYLAAAVPVPVFDQPGDLDGAVRLLVSLRFPGDDRLVATMATLGRDQTTAARRWTL